MVVGATVVVGELWTTKGWVVVVELVVEVEESLDVLETPGHIA